MEPSKAFDSVLQSLLVTKLFAYGVNPPACKYFVAIFIVAASMPRYMYVTLKRLVECWNSCAIDVIIYNCAYDNSEYISYAQNDVDII